MDGMNPSRSPEIAKILNSHGDFGFSTTQGKDNIDSTIVTIYHDTDKSKKLIEFMQSNDYCFTEISSDSKKQFKTKPGVDIERIYSFAFDIIKHEKKKAVDELQIHYTIPLDFYISNEEYSKKSDEFDLLKKQGLNFKYNENAALVSLFHDPVLLRLASPLFGNMSVHRDFLTMTMDSMSMDDPSLPLETDIVKVYEDREKKFLKSCVLLNDISHDLSITIPQQDIELKPTQLLEKLLLTHEGVCIGEQHDDSAAKKTLIGNFHKFKELGVNTLYLEFLQYDSMQAMLDSYFSSNEEMPRILEEFLLSRDYRIVRFGGASFVDLVKGAKEAGIRVVGIDTSISFHCGGDDKHGIRDFEKRILSMNTVAVAIIEENQRKFGGKYISFMGLGHAGRSHDTPKVKGVAEMLAIPSVSIQTKDEEMYKKDRVGGYVYTGQ